MENNNVFAIIEKLVNGDIVTKALFTDKEMYDLYKETRNTKDTKTLVLNLDHPKVCNRSDKIMDNIYNSSSYVDNTFDGIPISFSEEEVVIDAEYQLMAELKILIKKIETRLNEVKFIKFKKEELDNINNMIKLLNHLIDRYEVSIEEGEEFIFNYKQVIKLSGIE